MSKRLVDAIFDAVSDDLEWPDANLARWEEADYDARQGAARRGSFKRRIKQAIAKAIKEKARRVKP